MYDSNDNGQTWTEQQILVASDGVINTQFAASVTLYGDTVVIGAYWDVNGGTFVKLQLVKIYL